MDSLFLQQKGGAELPDIEAELERFKESRVAHAFYPVEDRVSIAAMVAILFGSYYFINILTTPSVEPITVFSPPIRLPTSFFKR